jgi:hypothetical protein
MIVEEYSQCEITIPGDKPPALSGIARLVQEATADVYLAGLWKSRLRDSLEWSVREPAAKTPVFGSISIAVLGFN